MTEISRRELLGSAILGAAAGTLPATAQSATACVGDAKAPEKTWRRGIEGQRQADLGDGTFLNPIVPGDHADPTILKDGDDYYMTFSSFDAYPGVVIWHSRDLVNWQPLVATLTKPIGSVWACELTKHKNRYYIYIPARWPDRKSTYVIYADNIRGPWSDPIDLNLPNHIDPGHVVGEDGKRYLFLSGGDRVRLTDDGLATDGPVEHVYDPWRYPEDWVVETFAPEGPKVMRHGEYFYMITAVGGTAGPPTGHMVIVARSKSIHGPWENDPANPIVRTYSAKEKWWSRGHATLVEGPAGDWWMVYHGYENGYWTLGRQTLLDPVEWTKDGWFRAKGGDLSQPIAKPAKGRSSPNGMPLSDDFSTNRFGVLWGFYNPGPNEMSRVQYQNKALRIAGKGEQPYDCSPLSFIVPDTSYRVTVDIELQENAQAGLLLFYNKRLYCGLGFNASGLVMHRYGLERRNKLPPGVGRRLHLQIENDQHIVTIRHSTDGKQWKKYDVQMEVSGYHHNVAYDFLSLRPAIYVAGQGAAVFRNMRYEAIEVSTKS
ncbi:family 43 glycosylhydrolase [Steroidobacter sp. S1-65]|uniref:Family 43 glycosylhydrolase n=1 Tax=Steroidobacter gossypii TaxID=2805490 RepID=A0ABS1WS25_9GAMM|nr:family 43 glycosylhydrolase [Steroidobacter gossypii]MBM0103779.1 family 43 glycosylhydrolase [Steroidobacter gossypii]